MTWVATQIVPPDDLGGNGLNRADSGGGGNRTRVRGRTGMSVYKHRSPFRFALRPVGDLPTAELALLKCRASDEWLFFGAEPAS